MVVLANGEVGGVLVSSAVSRRGGGSTVLADESLLLPLLLQLLSLS